MLRKAEEGVSMLRATEAGVLGKSEVAPALTDARVFRKSEVGVPGPRIVALRMCRLCEAGVPVLRVTEAGVLPTSAVGEAALRVVEPGLGLGEWPWTLE
mmetsp:Transcript_20629/g.37568  ORF Transcript_20629/g.37568 Transcript_20629/m.37568 type:complete len:99 (+) Transcript_20629:261-557(+)